MTSPLSITIPQEIIETCWLFYNGDRVVWNVTDLPAYPLTKSQLFPDDNQAINLPALIHHLRSEGRLELDAAFALINKTIDILSKEPNVLKINVEYEDESICIIGNVMSQYYDFLNALEAAGNDPKDTPFVFLGGYVNRACHGTEVIFHLCALKIKYPDNVILLRGNHETRTQTEFFNFRQEVMHKYDKCEKLYESILELFDNLPICAVLNDEIFCISSGLSPNINTLQDIDKIDRFCEPKSTFIDLLYSDPWEPKSEDGDETEMTEWGTNPRNDNYTFGKDVVQSFLDRNNLKLIIRSHRFWIADGYVLHFINEETNIPRVITLSSAPNSWSSNGIKQRSKGAVIILKGDDNIEIKQFEMTVNPYYLPNFQDLFTWSLPFVAEKVTDIIYAVLKYKNDINLQNNTYSLPDKFKQR